MSKKQRLTEIKQMGNLEDNEILIHGIESDLRDACDKNELMHAIRLKVAAQRLLHILGTCENEQRSLREAISEASQKHQLWVDSLNVGDIFDFKWDNGLWYPCKLLKREGIAVFVHFMGWKDDNYDLKVSVETCAPTRTFREKKLTAQIKRSASMMNSEDKTQASEQHLFKSASGRAIKLKAPSFAISASVTKKKPSDPTTRPDRNDWYCSVCGQLELGEDDNLVMCDGPCLRSFHSGCLGSSEEENGEGDWFCLGCKSKRHVCFACGLDGADQLEIFKCSSANCGKYYHVLCLERPAAKYLTTKLNWGNKTVSVDGGGDDDVSQAAPGGELGTDDGQLLGPEAKSPASRRGRKKKRKLGEKEIEIEKEKEKDSGDNSSSGNGMGSESALTTVEAAEKGIHDEGKDATGTSNGEDPDGILFTFKCPLHRCHTCSAFHGNGKETCKGLVGCLVCPRGFHSRCIPPGSRYDPFYMICPEHPERELPSRVEVRATAKVLTSSSYRLLWEQLGLDGDDPKASDPGADHFKLPVSFKKDVENEPKSFTSITKLLYDTYPSEIPAHYQEDEPCNCAEKCGESCINRLLKIECDKRICRVGEHCTNRALQQRQYAKSQRVQQPGMGWGLRAMERICKGSLVIEYIGEVIDDATMRQRMTDQRKNSPTDHDFYIMELDNGIYVDGKHKGNESRFINHSCDPNCELQRWFVRGGVRIAICAIRDIAPGEALSYDYQFDTNEEGVFACHCKTSRCRGTMAPKKRITDVDAAALSRAERKKLITQGKLLERSLTEEQRQMDELLRSYTSNFLPGDGIHEVRQGPLRSSFPRARRMGVFLPRNTRHSHDFRIRRQVFGLAHAPEDSASDSGEDLNDALEPLEAKETKETTDTTDTMAAGGSGEVASVP